MMKQRIVLKVAMTENEKLRKKAMTIASGTPGVTSVSIQGQNDQLVVLGENIDTAELIRELRKKVGSTNIITVQAAPPQPPQQQPPQPHPNEMPPARRCICEIPNSGFCGFCRYMNQNHYYHAVVPAYNPSPMIYVGPRDDSDGCAIM